VVGNELAQVNDLAPLEHFSVGFILRDGAEFIIGRAFARPVGASSG
jgi:hypothetical protein